MEFLDLHVGWRKIEIDRLDLFLKIINLTIDAEF